MTPAYKTFIEDLRNAVIDHDHRHGQPPTELELQLPKNLIHHETTQKTCRWLAMRGVNVAIHASTRATPQFHIADHMPTTAQPTPKGAPAMTTNRIAEGIKTWLNDLFDLREPQPGVTPPDPAPGQRFFRELEHQFASHLYHTVSRFNDGSPGEKWQLKAVRIQLPTADAPLHDYLRRYPLGRLQQRVLTELQRTDKLSEVDFSQCRAVHLVEPAAATRAGDAATYYVGHSPNQPLRMEFEGDWYAPPASPRKPADSQESMQTELGTETELGMETDLTTTTDFVLGILRIQVEGQPEQTLSIRHLPFTIGRNPSSKDTGYTVPDQCRKVSGTHLRLLRGADQGVVTQNPAHERNGSYAGNDPLPAEFVWRFGATGHDNGWITLGGRTLNEKTLKLRLEQHS